MDPDVIVCPMSPVSGDESINSYNIKAESSGPNSVGHPYLLNNNNVAAGVPASNCAACQKPIVDKYYLQAVDRLWHEECLKVMITSDDELISCLKWHFCHILQCSVCNCQLLEKGSLYTRTDLILCKRDYLRYKKTQFIMHKERKRNHQFHFLGCLAWRGHAPPVNESFLHAS